MLTKDQLEKIFHLRQHKEEPLPLETLENQEILRTYHITGILYSDPKQWTVWINDQPFTPQSALLEPGVTVIAKDHLSIEIRVGERPYLLFPGQTFTPKLEHSSTP